MSMETPPPPSELSFVLASEMPKPPVIQDAPVNDLAALFKLSQRMWSLCRQEDGVGLSAVQVGIPWRMFITEVPERGLEVFLNCHYEPTGDMQGWSMEGCLSLPRDADGQRPTYVVRRHYAVRLVGHRLVWDANLAVEAVDEVVEGFRAVVLQHEIGHQDGVLISDIGRPLSSVRVSGGASVSATRA